MTYDSRNLRHCPLACAEGQCKAKEHDCPSDCPALPWQRLLEKMTQMKELLGGSASKRAWYKCEDCGHEQQVTEITTANQQVYLSSAANWCDACGDGLPLRMDPQP